MKSIRHLGVSFCNGSIQLAEIEHGKHTTLTGLAERETNIDLVQAGIHLSAEHPQVATLVGELRDLLKRNKIATRLVSYALPADPVFINIIPITESLQGPALTEYLHWEIRQYFPDAGPKDFIVDSHHLPSRDKEVKPGFVVGVRRGMVSFLQRVTKELSLQLQMIDVDHLSSEKTLSFNYPEVGGHNVALFCVRMTGVIASTVRDGEIIEYRAYKEEPQGGLPKVVTSYLKHLKQLEMEAPDALFLYGEQVGPEMLKEIRDQADTQTIVLNSLRKLPVAGKLYEPFVKENHRFAPAIGLGLRSTR
jgi:Tfp pilus assembly PilM family ATPase